MSGFSMMFIGAALLAMTWLFLRYEGWDGPKAVVLICGGLIFVTGAFRALL